jgi:hypothetical protein
MVVLIKEDLRSHTKTPNRFVKTVKKVISDIFSVAVLHTVPEEQ